MALFLVDQKCLTELIYSDVLVFQLSLVIVMWAPPWLRDFMGNMDLPSVEYRSLLVLIACINAIVSFLFEKVFVEHFLLDYMERWVSTHSFQSWSSPIHLTFI